MIHSKYIGWEALAAFVVVVGLGLGGFSIAPWAYMLVALVCPVMMLFMMRGMDGGASGDGSSSDIVGPARPDSK